MEGGNALVNTLYSTVHCLLNKLYLKCKGFSEFTCAVPQDAVSYVCELVPELLIPTDLSYMRFILFLYKSYA